MDEKQVKPTDEYPGFDEIAQALLRLSSNEMQRIAVQKFIREYNQTLNRVDLSESHLSPRERLDRHVFFANETERQKALDFIQACLSQTPRPLLVITGPTGSGKSRLLATLASIVGANDILIVGCYDKAKLTSPAFIDGYDDIPDLPLVAMTLRDYEWAHMEDPGAVVIRMVKAPDDLILPRPVFVKQPFS